jgi:type IV pilus assembly protein PilY1
MGFTSKVAKRVGPGLISGILALSVGPLHAAPGVLAQLPLFLATPVQPNIFFLLDDSGSMDWEVLRRSDGGSGDLYLDYTPDSTRERIEHCVGINVLAYDPDKAYTPWFGVDRYGVPFDDEHPESARVNPYTGSSNTGACHDDGEINNVNGRTCDLINGFGGNGAYYVPWDDDGDGEYDDGECSTDAADRVYVSSMTTAERINFANWFSYYRKREYVMKRAVSEIVDDSQERMGFATINRNNHVVRTGDEVGTQVRDVDDLSVPINAASVANKRLLLDNLLGVNSNSGTPLRMGLRNVGRYFAGGMGGDNALFGDPPDEDPDSALGTSPILNTDLGGTCQQNFAIVMSDGFWNGSDRFPEEIRENNDGDGNSDFDGLSYADSWRDTLADAAMMYYEIDLMGDLDDEVPMVEIPVASGDVTECDAVHPDNAHLHPNCYDTNSAQHLVTYTVAFGVRGSIPETNSADVPCLPTSRSGTAWPSDCPSGWPEPVRNTSTTVDDMMHAAWNGRGLFLSAKDPDELINSLQNAIEDIESKTPASAAAVSVDGASISGGGNIFSGKFDTNYWTGELYSYEISGAGEISTTPTWEAHELLDTRGYSTRIAVTYNGTTGLPFAFPGDYRDATDFGDSEISQEQVDDLMYNAPYPVTSEDATEIAENQAFGENLVAYLKGDASNEGKGVGEFRRRDGHKLGDIIHSSPVYVGDPEPTLYYDTSYQAWANNTVSSGGAKGRREMIYVGANDGGLHAFDATTGEEIFVYFPKAVFSDIKRWGLHYLADRDYEHRYYVDGDISVEEVYADIDGTGDKWRTVLIGMLRGGGRSVFAIDISEPDGFSNASDVASKILWEFSHTELGFTYTKATVAKMNDGRWAAIFGNGYHPDDAATGEAVLFIKYLDDASPSYRMISTGVGSNTAGDCLDAASSCNGLSTPAVVDLGADRVADRIYAGDLMGNLWAFDVSSSNPVSWGLGHGSSPLIAAKDSVGLAQPITSKPSVVLHPTERHSSTSPNTMVFFGTGQYVTENDVVLTDTNTFYGIWDDGSAITSARDVDLVEQTITLDALGAYEVRIMSNNPVNYTMHRGWFVDLPDTGERIVSPPIAAGQIVLYSTIVPETSLCSSTGGYSWIMLHSLIDGSEPDFIAFDVNGDGVFDESDQVGGNNVSGKKFGELIWPLTLVKGDGHHTFTYSGGSTGAGSGNAQLTPDMLRRSSWGRYNTD